MVINELSQLKAYLKGDMRSNGYIICGEEHYLCNLAYNQILAAFLSAAELSTGLTILDTEKTSAQDIADTIEAMPMMGGKRVVVLDSPSFSKMAQDKYDVILSALSDIPPYTVVICNIKSAEFEFEKNKRCKDIYNLIDKNAVAILFNKQAPKDIADFIIRTLKKANKEISKNAANFLIEHCGTDMSVLNQELNKLSYCSQSIITEDIIRAVTIESVDAQIYDLSKAVAAGNLDKSMEIIDSLYYLRQPAVVILSSLSYYFADIYRAKTGKENNVETSDIALSFGYKPNDFRMRNAYRDCSKYTTQTLADILEILALSDFELKSSKLSDRIIIEKAVAQIFNTIRKRK